MTLANVETGEVVELCSREQARVITDRIIALVSTTWELVIQAYVGQAWTALGYDSWDAYCAAEFQATHLRLPLEERTEVVASLRDAGMPYRAIAAATGSSVGSVHQAANPERSKMNAADKNTHQKAGAGADGHGAEGDASRATDGRTSDPQDADDGANGHDVGDSEPDPAPAHDDDGESFADRYPELAVREKFDKAMASADRVLAFTAGAVADAYCTDNDGRSQLTGWVQHMRRFLQGIEDGINRNKRLRSVK